MRNNARGATSMLLIVGSLLLVGAGCGGRTDDVAEKEKVEKSAQELEESRNAEKDEFEKYKRATEIACNESVAMITGIDIARCRDLQKNKTLYELGLFSESSKDFSYLPAFCARKVDGMSALELLDCVRASEEKDEALFDELE